jgi:PAP2 superfamily protein
MPARTPIRRARRAAQSAVRLPQGWRDAARQVALWALIYTLYETVRGLTEGKAALAFANGHAVIDIERATGTYFEATVQSWFIDHRWLMDVFNWGYMNVHFVVTTAFLAWLYLRRNARFYFVRNMFMAAMGMALMIHALLPTAPPRMFAGEGFVDTIQRFGHVNQDSGAINALVNSYAAVPSMHCGFALMVGITAIALSRRRVFKLMWACYPLLVLFLVVVTANHFWLDGLAGAAVAALAALVARGPLARLRPQVWAWRVAPRDDEAIEAPAHI